MTSSRPEAKPAVREGVGGVSPAQVRRLQLTQLGIADAVTSLCDAHGIAYVLLGGSALGARRHGGFIPWDDDMDLGMLRADFERFLVIARHQLGAPYHVQHWLSDRHMGVPIAKVRLDGTRLVEAGSRDLGGHKGIAIDIFPFDNMPGALARPWWLLRLKVYKRLLRHASGYTVRPLPLPALALDLPLRWLAHRLSPVAIKRRMDRLMRRHAAAPSAEVLCVGGAYDFTKDRLDRRWLTERRAQAFEGRRFACPAALDDYLAHMYGDFLALPPPEQRVGRHAILALDFGAARAAPPVAVSARAGAPEPAVHEMEG